MILNYRQWLERASTMLQVVVVKLSTFMFNIYICKKHVSTLISWIDSYGCDLTHLKLVRLVNLGAFDKYEII
jgi:hypothetical protein